MLNYDDAAVLESHIQPGSTSYLSLAFVPGNMSTSSNAHLANGMLVEVILFTPDAESTQFLSEEDYPALARIWDNKDDDIFDSI